MPRCNICEKKPLVGNQVSHANNKTKTRSFPNVRRMRVLVQGVARRLWVCTRCLRSGLVSKPA